MHAWARRVTAACLTAALALSLTACHGSRRRYGSGYGNGYGYGNPAPTHTWDGDLPTADPSPTQSYWQSPQIYLESDTLLLLTDARTGSSTIALPPTVKAGRLDVAAYCQGAGSITVDTGKAGVTYTVNCSNDSIGDSRGHTSATAITGAELQVTADPNVRWQVGVGWSSGT